MKTKKKITIQDIKRVMKIMDKTGMKPQKPRPLLFTMESIELISEEEKSFTWNADMKTGFVRGYPFALIESMQSLNQNKL